MKSTFKNPQYFLRKSGKGVHKIKIEFLVEERHINYAIFQLGEWQKISDLTPQEIQKKVTQNFFDFGAYGTGDEYSLSKGIYINDSMAQNFGVRFAKDTDGYNMDDVNKEKMSKKCIALGKRLFPAYYTKQKTNENE